MSDLSKCKSLCSSLNTCCHNTKNRVIEKMCDCEKHKCKPLADYLQSLMILESLCNYICLCCCEHETITASIMSELKTKCNTMKKQCGKITKLLTKEQCAYLRCGEIDKLCCNCCDLKSKKTKKK